MKHRKDAPPSHVKVVHIRDQGGENEARPRVDFLCVLFYDEDLSVTPSFPQFWTRTVEQPAVWYYPLPVKAAVGHSHRFRAGAGLIGKSAAMLVATRKRIDSRVEMPIPR